MAQLLPEGATAPDFVLNRTPDQKLALHELRGQPVVLCFYPADWSPVCGDQLSIYDEILDRFTRHRAQLLGISVDGVWCHAAYAKHQKLRFPLLSDFEPKGAVAREYGVYREGDGLSERALFLVSDAGQVFWRHVSPIAVNPGADGILEALERYSQRYKGGER